MRRIFRSALAVALAALVIAASVGTWELGSEQDKRDLARLTDSMKTHCIGRFLIDMPAEAQVEIGRARISGFDVGAFEETREEFQKRLADREAQIRAKPDQAGGNKNLESARELRTDKGIVGKMFVHGRIVSEGTRANGLELEHYRYEGVAIEALVHGAGISIDLATDYHDPAQIEDLPKLVAQLVPNPDNRAPSEAGFCLDRAYIRDPLTAEQGEQIMMFGGIQRNPDVESDIT